MFTWGKVFFFDFAQFLGMRSFACQCTTQSPSMTLGFWLGCHTCPCWAWCGWLTHFWISLNQQWLWLLLLEASVQFRLPVAKSYVVSAKSRFWFCLCIFRWSCEIMLCTTSYQERSFYQTNMLFKDTALCNSSQSQQFGAVKQMLLLTGWGPRIRHFILSRFSLPVI